MASQAAEAPGSEVAILRPVELRREATLASRPKRSCTTPEYQPGTGRSPLRSNRVTAGAHSVRVGDVGLIAREAGMVALVMTGAERHSDLLDQQQDPVCYAASVRRSKWLLLATLYEIRGSKPPRHSPYAPVTAAMLVERIRAMGRGGRRSPARP